MFIIVDNYCYIDGNLCLHCHCVRSGQFSYVTPLVERNIDLHKTRRQHTAVNIQCCKR